MKSKKKVGSKISKIKQNNQKRTKLAKKGKLKPKKKSAKKLTHNPKNEIPQNIQDKIDLNEEDNENEEVEGEGMLEMMEPEDIDFLKNAVKNRSYHIFSKIGIQRKKIKNDIPDSLEEQYEEKLDSQEKKLKYLLPIKTKHGLINRTMDAPENENIEIIEETIQDAEEGSDDERLEIEKPISTADLFAWRQQMLEKRKYDIGILCSDLLENPESKIANLKKILDFMDEKYTELRISVVKLCAFSLLEVFKDILPSYQIKTHITPEGVKLKKVTIHLQNFETTLLKSYKIYLQKLEKLAKVFNPKKGDTSQRTEGKIYLGQIAIQCLCDLIVTHPYFNFSKNLAQMLVLYLDVRWPNVREICLKALGTVFKKDKRGDISLDIVRAINSLIKKRLHCVHPEVLQVLLDLKIKEVNLDKEKEDELKEKKFMNRKQKLLNMSKKERKRSKKLEQLEKELLETKAEENKQAKHKLLTEITKMIFTIYFRILKETPSSKLLGVTLEGLAKFAHCINLDFYHDLVNVLDNLMIENTIGPREQLHCVQTVFTILSGHGDILNVDPFRFYTHLYRNMLHIYADKNHNDIRIILKTMELVLIKHKRKISQQRLLAFTKRLCILCLQILHNGSLGCLTIIKTILQLNKSVDVLLDVDTSLGQGLYLPEIEEPEYCNANSSALWELSFLKKHYHPKVCELADYIAEGVPIAGTAGLEPELLKLNANDIFEEYNPEQMVFKPSIKPPSSIKNMNKKVKKTSLKDENLENYISSIYESIPSAKDVQFF